MREFFSWFVPEPASTLSTQVDTMLYGIFWISLIVLGVVGALLVFYVITSWEKAGEATQEKVETGLRSALSSSIFALLVLVGILGLFFWGLRVFVSHQVVPRDPLMVIVMADKDRWTFIYPNGAQSREELMAPIDRPVLLRLMTESQTRDFSIPAFRLRAKAVAGHVQEAWFESTQVGSYPIWGSFPESDQTATKVSVRVVSDSDFQVWLKEGTSIQVDATLEEIGQQLYRQNACFTCHSLDGSPGVGPTWKGVYGSWEELADGTKVMVDDDYIRESILYPAKRVTAGYPPIMPSYEGILNDEQILAITAFMKSLGD